MLKKILLSSVFALASVVDSNAFWTTQAKKCDEPSIIKLIEQEHINEFSRMGESDSGIGNMIGNILGAPSGDAPKVIFTLKHFREFRKYDTSLKKRFCEATAYLQVKGMHLGMMMNNMDPIKLAEGITFSYKYTIQIDSKGDDIVDEYDE